MRGDEREEGAVRCLLEQAPPVQKWPKKMVVPDVDDDVLVLYFEYVNVGVKKVVMSWQWDALQERAHLESGQKTPPRPNH